MKKLALLLILVVLSAPVFATTYYVKDEDYFGAMTIEDDDSLIMTGGGVERLNGNGNGILDIRDTSSPVVRGESGIYSLSAYGSSKLYFSGGSVRFIGTGDYATAVLTGGQIAELTCTYDYASPTHIELICKSWNYNTTVHSRILTGIWGDGSTFNIRCDTGFFIPSLVIDNITFTIIPEPATLFLLAAVGILLKRK